MDVRDAFFDTEWLPSMQREEYTLTNRQVVAVEGDELVVGPEHGEKKTAEGALSSELRLPADVITLANGFEATRWLHPLRLRSRRHRTARRMEGTRWSSSRHGIICRRFFQFL